MADHEIGAILTLRDNMSATLRGVRGEQAAFRQDTTDTQRVVREPMNFRVNAAAAAKAITGIALAAGAAVLAAGGLAVAFSDDLQKSINGVQSATGVADEMMGDMRTAMLAIYNDNFGENFEEIGKAMSLINQQTGLAGDALKKTTEDALALKDTFGLEVADSIKGANQLIKQFGMDGNTAYNLIAQGAQWGLDSNGDLLDTLNEYSGTFQAQGFSAEEMFNMISNASQSGIRDLDLAADAIKEFGIRSKDGSTTSAAGFEALGLNAAKMTKAFGAGGDTAKAAFDKTTKALFAMENPVAQNAAGVALFGTQWEDMGAKGIEALTNTQGEISKSVDALGKINAVKYNTFGEAMEGIKRNLQTGLLVPLGQQLLPKMNELAGWVTTNMPKIQNEISFSFNTAGDAIKATGTALTETKTFFQAHWNVVSPILAGIAAGAGAFYLITGAMKVWKAVTEAATIAQGIFNFTLSASPIGKAVVIIGLLVAAGVLLYQNWDWLSAKAGEVGKTIGNAFKSGVNVAVDAINWLTDKLNVVLGLIGVKIPSVAHVALDTTNTTGVGSNQRIGGNAKGTDNWRGGPTWVGEEGPEILNLPSGSKITPNDKIPTGGKSSGVVIQMNGTIIREEADIHKLASAIVTQLDAAASNM